ncbi:MAG: SIMPL domain-containing protein [Candidatus Pacebacteria bacterium]|nr:SIMPL domain-containing protein [Candidatus Paceibacterota bacterium]
MEKEDLFNDNGFKGLVKLFLIILIIFFVFSILNSREDKETINTISVTGSAEINAKPDVAQINLTVITGNKDLGLATEENNIKINDIISFLKEKNIEDKDIKTSTYNINPRYEYGEDYRNRYLAGYDVTQSLIIKIRDLNMVGDIISGATSRGANDVSGLSFIIDNDELLKEQAKEQAITDAKDKALKLEKDLGVSLKEIIGFYENTYNPVYYEATSSYKMLGMGGAADSVSPSIETGENTITSNVTIIYKVK